MKTIYNTYVEMKSQEQCDRMKQLCIDNELDIWNEIIAYEFFDFYDNYFYFDEETKFGVYCDFAYYLTKITEQEFIKLLKNE